MLEPLLHLSTSFQLDWQEWALAFLAAAILGISKSGIKGISAIIVIIMALVFGSKASTGIIVPMLIFADIIAVIYYKREVQWPILFKLMPWMILGILIGVVIGKDMPEAIFKQGLATVILISAVILIFWERRKSKEIPHQWWFAGSMGTLAGIATMLGNLAGAFSNIFFLAMRLPKVQFIGTAAWLFFLVNLFKLPFHIFVWETITLESLAVNLRLFPAIVLGFLFGLQIVNRLKEKQFRYMIIGFMVLGAVFILLK